MHESLTFDWSVRLDTLLMVVTMLLGGGVVWGALRSDLKALTEKVKHVEETVDEQRDMLVAIARQDEQLKAHDRRLADLETRRRP